MTMLAARIHGHGGNEVLRLDELPIPARKPGDVRVRMVAGGLNRVDLYMRTSGAGITHRLPVILGLDGAGVVDEADSGSTFRAGDPVVLHPGLSCGTCEFCRKGEDVLCIKTRIFGEQIDGTFAGFVCAPEANAFRKPDSLDFLQAASLSVAWLTAWRMIVTKARLEPGETVLIFGVGGSVSLAATQIASALGARTIVTSRDERKLERARAFGAAEMILDAGGATIVDRVVELTDKRGVDVVIENVGKAAWGAAMRSLVRGGRLVTCGATTGDDPSADLRRLFIRQLQIFGSTLGTRAELAAMINFVAEKGLKPHIDAAFPLRDIAAALDHLESGRQFGKIGLAIAPLPSAPDPEIARKSLPSV
jgi:NADPH:quinone reductase-like Zn-dependent oxidoreductase